MDAEAARLGSQYGLGQCAASWDASRFLGRVVFGWFLLVMATLAGLGLLQAVRAHASVPAAFTEILFVTATAVLMVSIPPRKRKIWLYLFDGGVARVSNGRPRLITFAWADLDTLSINVVSGYDGDYVAGCLLRDRTGRRLELGREQSFGFYAREAITAAAEREIAGRHLVAMTEMLDTGQPVTIGSLTVDHLGIRSRGTASQGGRWQVPWQQARQVSIRLHGQRVMVTAGRRAARRAALDGQPNSFLARYVIEHAARRAGVPVDLG
jgi:hypothetical protein